MNAADIMALAGYTAVGTGGNVRAWRLDPCPDYYVLICYGEGQTDGPIRDKQWTWGTYYHDRPEQGGEELTLRQALKAATKIANDTVAQINGAG